MAFPSCSIYLKKNLLNSFLVCCFINLQAQMKWDGDGGDGQWSTAANWVGDLLPVVTDDVLLDNSIVPGNYTVSLPGSASPVAVRSVTITPSAAKNIQLILPVSSTATPAFITTGPGYGIIINNGATLLNSSGITSGSAISVNDSIRINNGGQYTHNTRSAHASLVTILSRQPGTEKGIVKFDPPGGGYTLATTGRIYGTLILSAAAAGGSLAYASSAASPFMINGDLIIEHGVTLNLDITAATAIKGNYLQLGGVFNLASQPNNNVVYVKGDFIQQSGSITETSSGLPAIELNGSSNQYIQVSGVIGNSVGFTINNPAGVTLNSPLSLPYQLKLLNGIVNTQAFNVTLLAGCNIVADSGTNNSFINGSLRKEGLSNTAYFLFPVGKGHTQRWLELKNATGNFNVEFFKGDPHGLSSIVGAGIHHISSIEYWSVVADAAPVPAGSVELSFDNVNSGGVTDLSTLRVAQDFANVWKDKGNTATSGSAGAAGSVTSQPVNIFFTPDNYFALAGSDAFQNPLPLQLISFNATQKNGYVQLSWSPAPSLQTDLFEVQAGADGIHFETLAGINTFSNQAVYSYNDVRPGSAHRYYRLAYPNKSGRMWYSKTLTITDGENPLKNMIAFTEAKQRVRIVIGSSIAAKGRLVIYSEDGRLVNSKNIQLQEGSNTVLLPMEHVAAGIYIAMVAVNAQLLSTRFARQ